jgi:hypothetical protein
MTLRKALDGIDVVYQPGRRVPEHTDAGVELARAVCEYFGAAPILPVLSSDRALRNLARAIVKNAARAS